MEQVKKVIITGSSGFIGSSIMDYMDDFNFKPLHGRKVSNYSDDDLRKIIEGSDVLINLAGKSIFNLWTHKTKMKIYNSRIVNTRRLVEAVNRCDNPPKQFINASAIGIYNSDVRVNDYSEDYAKNFLAKVVKDWEGEALNVGNDVTKVCICRFGIVLGDSGGAYPVFRKLTKYNLGAFFGQGDQYLSFIYIKDLVRIIRFILENQFSGVINVTAPEPTCYKTFYKLLKTKMNSFVVWKIPELFTRITGETRVLVTEGQCVIPERLMKAGFIYEAPDIETCIQKIEEN